MNLTIYVNKDFHLDVKFLYIDIVHFQGENL